MTIKVKTPMRMPLSMFLDYYIATTARSGLFLEFNESVTYTKTVLSWKLTQFGKDHYKYILTLPVSYSSSNPRDAIILPRTREDKSDSFTRQVIEMIQCLNRFSIFRYTVDSFESKCFEHV